MSLLARLRRRRRHHQPGDVGEADATGSAAATPSTGVALLAPGLRLPRHRGTTAHLGSAYPCQAEAGLGCRGVYMGANISAGGAGFFFDPFELYGTALTNPNMLILGELGFGKSTTVKTFLYRMLGVYGPRRFVAVLDPKGEYDRFATATGLAAVRLYPGGEHRVNPLDPAPGDDPADVTGRQAMVAAMLGTVLGRNLDPLEDAALGWAIATLAGDPTATLVDLAHLLTDPTAELAALARSTGDTLATALRPLSLALGKLLDRSLRGMFDGPTNVRLDWDRGAGIVVDLSAVFHDRDALPLVMTAACAWLQGVLSTPSGRRCVQVLDEGWALLGSERTARYLQAAWKLARAYGVANILVCHRLTDLRAQADDGTAAQKVAAGLLADTQTRVVLRQAIDQLADARDLLGLTPVEADLITRLATYRALWKVQGRAAVVQHVLGPDPHPGDTWVGERWLCDTDAAMAAT
jgi:type IV secretory pathway VirB4 component